MDSLTAFEVKDFFFSLAMTWRTEYSFPRFFFPSFFFFFPRFCHVRSQSSVLQAKQLKISNIFTSDIFRRLQITVTLDFHQLVDLPKSRS